MKYAGSPQFPQGISSAAGGSVGGTLGATECFLPHTGNTMPGH